MWAATVKTDDFTIVKRGVKFLNSFPKYVEDLEYLDSVGEVLMNCENIIPLQEHKSLTFTEFCNIFKDSSLLSYLLSKELSGKKEKNETR